MKTIAQVLLAAVVADGLPTQWECSWQLQDVNIGNRIVINNDGEYPQVPSTANNEVTITRATVTSTATATATPEIEMSSTATLSRTATTASLTLIPLSTDSVSMTLSKSVSRSESESMTDDSEPTSTLTEHSTTLISGQQTETVTRSLSRSKTESKTIQTWDQIIDSFPSFEIARWATCDLGNVLLVDSALSVAGCLSRCETTSNCVYSESTLNSCRLLTTCSSWNSIMNNSTAVTVKKTSLGNQIPSFFTLYKFNSTCQTGTRSDQETLSECALECSKSNTCMYFSFTNSVNDINGCLIGNTCSYGPSDVELSTQVFRRTPEPLLISIEQGINTTYADAVYSCLNTSRRLCTASEVCRFLLKNNINNQRWIPVADNNNQWLQVATTCRSLSDKLIGVDDNLGLNTPSPPWTDPHSEAFCCPFDYDEVNLCSVPGAIVSDSESLFDDVAGPEACQVQCQSSSSCIAFEYNVMTGLCKTFDAIQSSSTQVQPDATLIAPPQCSPNVNWTCGIVEADTPTPVVDTPVPVYINPDLVLSHFIVKLRIAFADFNGVDFATRVVASLAAGATLDVSDSLEESPRVTAVTFSIGLTNSTGGQSQLFSLQNEVVTLMKRQLPPFDRSGYEVIVLRTWFVFFFFHLLCRFSHKLCISHNILIIKIPHTAMYLNRVKELQQLHNQIVREVILKRRSCFP